MLGRPRTGTDQSTLNDALALLAGLFAGARYTPLAPPYMFLADTLLDVYGEDLRARAFIFADPGRGNELCLRPDFTVPVALAHAAAGWETQASYAYQGPVFRSQPQGLGRPVEYIQAGIERFGDPDAATADAEVFVLLHRALAALGIGRPEVSLGDLSIPFAVLDALELPARRRAALRRHFWRPVRFQALLARAQSPISQRAELFQAAGDPDRVAAMMAEAGEPLGLRSAEEVSERALALAEEAREPAMDPDGARLIGEVLAVRGPAREAPDHLSSLTREAGIDIDQAIDRFAQRLDAIQAQGIPVDELAYDAGFGRNLEYYDGFVFEMRPRGQASHPPLAGGGRYDAMTVKLGANAPVPAVGGMIRPEAVLGARP